MNSKKFTMFGFGAIIIWGMGTAFTRTIGESLGAFTASALINIIAGIISIVFQLVSKGGLKSFKGASWRYWFWCGLLYIAFVASAYLSVNLAENREQVMVVVLINLLWPLMTLLFTIPILKAKASPWIIGSIIVSVAGITIGNLGDSIRDIPSFISNLSSNSLPYFLAFASALTWGLYSNLTRKFIGDSDCDGAGFFMLAIGLILGAVSLTMSEPRVLSGPVIGQLIYQSSVTIFLATLLWNIAMRKGNVVIVAVASNLSPLIAITSTALILGVAMTTPVIIGTVLVVAGTVWSKSCFKA